MLCHTGQWWQVFSDISLDECLEAIRNNAFLQPKWILGKRRVTATWCSCQETNQRLKAICPTDADRSWSDPKDLRCR
jgi:hypothetical protein